VRNIAILCVLGALGSLAGCGLADTATSAAVAAKTKAAELERAKETQQKVVGDLERAQQQADQRLREAESK
jgi:ABC-type phosphate transport system auxiliary subunit